MSIFSSLFKSTAASAADRRGQMRLRSRSDSFVRIDGRDVPLMDWSEYGFRAGPYKGSLIEGQKAKGEIVLQARQGKGPDLTLPVSFLVKRIDAWGLAAKFHGLERYKHAELRKAYRAWSTRTRSGS